MDRCPYAVKVLLAFSAAVLVVAALSATTVKVARDATEAERWVVHTHEVRDGLAAARAETIQIELSTQSFRITGESRHIAERNAAIANREVELQRVQELMADNAGQQQRLSQLREVINQRLAMAKQVEQLRNTQGAAAANAFVATAPLKETRELTHRLLRDLNAEELRLLDLRNADQVREREFMIAAGIAVSVTLFGLLSATFLLIRRQLAATAASQRALAESEESLSTTLRSIGDGMLATDTAGNVTRMNPVAEQLTGWSFVEAAGRPIDEVFRIVHEQTREAAEIPVTKVLSSGNIQILDEHTVLIARDGIERPIADSAAPIRGADGNVQGVVLVFRDETDQRRAQRMILEQNELLDQRVRERTATIKTLNMELAQRVRDLEQVSRALRTLSAGNHAMLRATDEQGLLDSMCEAIVSEGGYDTAVVWYRVHDEAKSLHPMAQSGYAAGLEGLRQMNVSWDDNECGRGAAGSAIRSGESIVLRDVISHPHYAIWQRHIPDKTSVLACPLLVDGEIIGALAIYDALKGTFDPSEVKLLCESADDLAFGITTLRARVEQQRVQAAVHRLTYYDPLTELPNERQFSNALVAAIETGIQLDRPVAVLQTNIERLSDINDTLGFGHGDQILREFGARLRAAAPGSAVVARLRGDEFGVLLVDCDRAAAAATVGELERALDMPFPVADIPLNISAQTGVVLFPEHGLTPHDLFRHMDIAVDQAKKRGARHAFFDVQQSQQRPNRLTMATELRQAIDDDELRVYLQPKIDLRSGLVCGAEALVRWMHPTKGLVPPGQFIELAEYTGLIKPLTEWVIESVLSLTRRWTDEGRALPIAVNLSARNLRDGELLEWVRRRLKFWNIAEGLFELEITEGTVMEDADYALSVLRGLRDEGIRLYIDDFGTGYSSLSYLQKLPVEYIKIDQSFVYDMLSSKESATIVRSTIDLVHDLGRKVVAEGVENIETLDHLSRLGCDIAQGYFIAKPMPAEDFQEWLNAMGAKVQTLPPR